MGMPSWIKKGIGCPWSFSCPPKDHPCSLPRIRVLILVANSDLHRNHFGELPFTLQTLLLLSTLMGLAHLFKYDLLGLWASTWIKFNHPPPPPPQKSWFITMSLKKQINHVSLPWVINVLEESTLIMCLHYGALRFDRVKLSLVFLESR